jgi:hypothetical protein
MSAGSQPSAPRPSQTPSAPPGMRLSARCPLSVGHCGAVRRRNGLCQRARRMRVETHGASGQPTYPMWVGTCARWHWMPLSVSVASPSTTLFPPGAAVTRRGHWAVLCTARAQTNGVRSSPHAQDTRAGSEEQGGKRDSRNASATSAGRSGGASPEPRPGCPGRSHHRGMGEPARALPFPAKQAYITGRTGHQAVAI